MMHRYLELFDTSQLVEYYHDRLMYFWVLYFDTNHVLGII